MHGGLPVRKIFITVSVVAIYMLSFWFLGEFMRDQSSVYLPDPGNNETELYRPFLALIPTFILGGFLNNLIPTKTRPPQKKG